MYRLHFGPGQSITSADIVTKLDPANTDHTRHIERIAELEACGIRYSGEDFDVLSSANRAAGGGK